MRNGEQSDAAARVVRDAAVLEGAQAWLDRAAPEAIAEGIAEAARALRHDFGERGGLLQTRLIRQSGLSPAMVRWAANTTLDAFDVDSLRALAHAHREQQGADAASHRTQAGAQRGPGRAPRGRPPGRGYCAVILSGNVCTAAVRAIALPLLAGRTVLAKTATGQDVMAQALRRALSAHDELLGTCVAVEVFGREDAAATSAMLQSASVASAYGDDDTLESLAGQLPERVPLLRHGPGVGAVYLPQASLSDTQARAELLARVALDVAAYDQRGCLSPHHVFIEQGPVAAAYVAAELSNALSACARELPRGAADSALLARTMQWRGVASACGELLEGDQHAVSIETRPRPGPGHRHVAVIPCEGRAALLVTLRSWGERLKALAAPGAAERSALSDALAPDQRPQLAAPGNLQTPPLDALWDGKPPLAGL